MFRDLRVYYVIIEVFIEGQIDRENICLFVKYDFLQGSNRVLRLIQTHDIYISLKKGTS